jgi:hypothetical protein
MMLPDPSMPTAMPPKCTVIDAFTTKPFCGIPDNTSCQQTLRTPGIVTEPNMSQTAFVRLSKPNARKDDNAPFGLRWFTPTKKVCHFVRRRSHTVLRHAQDPFFDPLWHAGGQATLWWTQEIDKRTTSEGTEVDADLFVSITALITRAISSALSTRA